MNELQLPPRPAAPTDRPPFSVRQARLTDADAVIAFDPVAAASRQRVNFIHQAITSRNAAVAVKDGRVVGFAVIDHAFFDHGFIRLVTVAPDVRRQGIGAALVRAMEAACKTAKLFTSTNASNEAMQALLTNVGYEPSGRIDNLDEGDPELIYFKRLRD